WWNARDSDTHLDVELISDPIRHRRRSKRHTRVDAIEAGVRRERDLSSSSGHDRRELSAGRRADDTSRGRRVNRGAMVNFIIPLKSRSVAADWALVVRMLENTLRSIFNQTVQDFRVGIACHEIPETSFDNDPRLEFICVDFPPPLSLLERNVDKF